MAYEFRPAVRTKTSVLIALAGASGSGKTFTAILMAFGLAYPDMSPAQIIAVIADEGRSRVCFIDTEGGRGLHYAPGEDQAPDFKDTFPFEYAEIRAPYTPEAYQDAIMSADKVGFDVVIVDSLSHEFESEGGIQEIAAIAEQGVLKPGVKAFPSADDRDGWKAYAVKPVKSPGNWSDAKTRHKRMVNRAIQSRAHVIFCLRAEEKMLLRQVPQLDNNGEPRMWNGKPMVKTEVVPAEQRPLLERWVPICEKRFMFEMTVSFLLLPSQPGVGHPIKNLQDQFKPMFPEDGRLGVANGIALAAWSHGRKGPLKQAADPTPAVDQTKPAAGKQTAEEWADEFVGKVRKTADRSALADLQERNAKSIEKLRSTKPALFRECERAITDRNIDFDADDSGPAETQRGEGKSLFGED